MLYYIKSNRICFTSGAQASVLKKKAALEAEMQAASEQVCQLQTSAYVSIRQHTSAYVSIRQHTSADVSIRQPTSGGERAGVSYSYFSTSH